MENHGKKMVAPIIITVLISFYVLAETAALLYFKPPWFVDLVFILVSIAVIGLMIGVLVSRIKEIRSGEEDDLSKY